MSTKIVRVSVNGVPDSKLIVKRSQIKDAGNGLYTDIDIAYLTPVIEYKGEIRQHDEDHDHTYCYAITEELCIDATDISLSNKARYVNDPFESKHEPNLEWFSDGFRKRLWLLATKDIKAGEELFISYGEEYWHEEVEEIESDSEDSEESDSEESEKESLEEVKITTKKDIDKPNPKNSK